ncbi:hypothetical protein MBLNU13_g04402t1 [Cladosporium sp. NU13]
MRFCLIFVAVVGLALYFYHPFLGTGLTIGTSGSAPHPPESLEGKRPRLAFATLLTAGSSHPDNLADLHDNYFIATRLLGYQLMYASETRSENIPFVVLATKAAHQKKVERPRRDGAAVIVVETVEKPDWIKCAGASNWKELFDKLRAWELVQFDRICFLNGDTVLNRPLDEIFNDPAVASQSTLARAEEGYNRDEGPLTPSYVFAGQPEMSVVHHYPPSQDASDYPNFGYPNTGFFVTQPSLELQKLYLAVLQIPDRFSSQLMEQNLFNYVHRSEEEGVVMPWKPLSSEWNVNYPTMEDFKGGVASLHEKWWALVDGDLGPYLLGWRWGMEGFYEAMALLR